MLYISQNDYSHINSDIQIDGTNNLSCVDANHSLYVPSGDGETKPLNFSWLNVAQKLHSN